MLSSTPPRFDAVIVGAGVAGSAAAILLAGAGWSVALVERQRFPRRKVCGECVAASNFPLLRRLGIGDAIDTLAGPDLRQVMLLRGDSAVTAALPAAAGEHDCWGRAWGREALDTALRDRARASGVEVFQPWSFQSFGGQAGAWTCILQAGESAQRVRLHASVMIDAHGSWEDLPTDRLQRRAKRSTGDLLAFKANFVDTSMRPGAIHVLALDGGYGGMVVEGGKVATVACCIRRDRLTALRAASPGLRAGEAVEAWLVQECSGVQSALHGASRAGPWMASGPLQPGIRLRADDRIFRIGNAAAEAHPIIGEGMSMALQSAALLCSHLLPSGTNSPPAAPSGDLQAAIQHRYAKDWRREFAARVRLANVFAQVAMRPSSADALMALTRYWPGLLTRGARWGGKARTVETRWHSLEAGTKASGAPPQLVSASLPEPFRQESS